MTKIEEIYKTVKAMKDSNQNQLKWMILSKEEVRAAQEVVMAAKMDTNPLGGAKLKAESKLKDKQKQLLKFEQDILNDKN